MLIGGLIGLAIYSVISVLSIAHIQSQVNKHNSNKLLVMANGRAKVTIDYGHNVIIAVACVSIGAVIGYFI